MDMEEELKHIHFKMRLLFNNSEVDRVVFDNDIKQDELTSLQKLMAKYRKAIDKGEEVFSGDFEDEVYKITPSKYGDHHFCESFTKSNWEEGQYKEVFEKLYEEK